MPRSVAENPAAVVRVPTTAAAIRAAEIPVAVIVAAAMAAAVATNVTNVCSQLD